MNENEIKRLLGDISRALNFLHSKKIIHKSLKPENVLFDDKGIIKLADFDLIPYIQSNSSTTSHEIKDESKIDVWLLGCIIYELCSLKVQI